ncbi:GNAT family N-acetyltransferase [Enemella sp. A6]|uniref:GNAT family N-acetyltransferase n=1 Tax=Enemella sp. A6 TaxID=3440152 RepID=UPI003EBE28B2
MNQAVTLVSAPPADAPRVSLRIADDTGARDLVGHPLGVDGPHLIVLPADAGPQWVERSKITHRRETGPRMVRPVSTPLDLQRVATHGWPGVERFRLGGWLLRAGSGWTSRANSTLVAGDPGLPVPEALAAVDDFYRHRDLPGRLQITLTNDGEPLGPTRDAGPSIAEVDAAAAAGGWRASDPVHVMVRDLTEDSLAPAALPDGLRPVWHHAPTPQWLTLLRGGEGEDPRAVPVLTAGPARYLTLVDEHGPVAIGRGAAAENWLGISCIEVHPQHRRRGLGRMVTQLLAADTTADFAYLQVESGNEPALALYDRLGFTEHHRYHYRTRADR